MSLQKRNDPNGTWEDYSIRAGTADVLDRIWARFMEETSGTSLPLGPLIDEEISMPRFCVRPDEAEHYDKPAFPVPLRETETAGALKYIERRMALALFNERSTKPMEASQLEPTEASQLKPMEASQLEPVNLNHVNLFLMQTYATILHEADATWTKLCGHSKLTPWSKCFMMDEEDPRKPKKGKIMHLIRNTDYHDAQSLKPRRMTAGIFRTKSGYFHHHPSLNVDVVWQLLGLTDKDFIDAGDDSEKIAKVIEEKSMQKTAEEWDLLNIDNDQAGAMVLTKEEFQSKKHGQKMKDRLPWTVTRVVMDDDILAVEPKKLPPLRGSGLPGILEGVKVVEFVRIIAGPTIGRILAEYGADVIKIVAPKPVGADVPWFQVDLNMGKQCFALNLKENESHKNFFLNNVLNSVDIILDGYSPAAIPKLLDSLLVDIQDDETEPGDVLSRVMRKLARRYQKHHVYVAENCFGHVGEWSTRHGWQQIADCVTGVAMEQGKFMFPANEAKVEPVVPPFPMSDYGAGCMGAIAALAGLYNRETKGGSWIGLTSLVQYDLLLLEQGAYGPDIKHTLRLRIREATSPIDPIYQQRYFGKDVELEQTFLKLKHWSSVDNVSGAGLWSMLYRLPKMFDPTNTELYEFWKAPGYKVGENVLVVQAVKPVAQIPGVLIAHRRPPIPNAMRAPDQLPSAPWAAFDSDSVQGEVLDTGRLAFDWVPGDEATQGSNEGADEDSTMEVGDNRQCGCCSPCSCIVS